MIAHQEHLIQKGTPSETGAEREYERMLGKRRDETLAHVEEGYQEWKKSRVYKIPQWLYGPPKGKLFTVACEDVPAFGDTSYLEFDSARTALILVDWQIDFCGEKGYVDVMGYPLSNTANPLTYAIKALKDFREAGIPVIHCREGHMPDLSDCPYNKLLRSKIIGKDAVGVGEQPKGGMGRLLLRGSKSGESSRRSSRSKRNTHRQGRKGRWSGQRLLHGPAEPRYHPPDVMRHNHRCLRSYHHEGGQ